MIMALIAVVAWIQRRRAAHARSPQRSPGSNKLLRSTNQREAQPMTPDMQPTP
jgi:hypothetical protein